MRSLLQVTTQRSLLALKARNNKWEKEKGKITFDTRFKLAEEVEIKKKKKALRKKASKKSLKGSHFLGFYKGLGAQISMTPERVHSWQGTSSWGYITQGRVSRRILAHFPLSVLHAPDNLPEIPNCLKRNMPRKGAQRKHSH